MIMSFVDAENKDMSEKWIEFHRQGPPVLPLIAT